MTFDWAEYLNVAGELAAIPFRPSIAEAKQRSAISRAYYAAFGKARVHLRDIDGDGNIPRGPQAHEYVRLAFKASVDPRRRSIGENLNRLRRARNRADYADLMHGVSREATFAIRLADHVIRELAFLQRLRV